MSVMAFDSPEEFNDYMQSHVQSLIDATQAADIERVLGEDEEGSYQINLSSAHEYDDTSLIVFIRVIGKTEFMAQAEDESEIQHYYERWTRQKETGMLLGECFSHAYQPGEYGDTHVTRMSLALSAEEWEVARQCNWWIGTRENPTLLGQIVQVKALEAMTALIEEEMKAHDA